MDPAAWSRRFERKASRRAVVSPRGRTSRLAKAVKVSSVNRRPRGTGSLIIRRDSGGRETWYGKWWVGDRQVMKKLDRKRPPSGKEGLTRAAAERELRRRMGLVIPPSREERRLTVGEAGDVYLRHLESKALKRSTRMDYRSILDVQLKPYFRDRSLDAITVQDVEDFITAKRREGKAPKSVRNYIGFLHSIFEYGRHGRRGWCRSNPVSLAENKPEPSDSTEIRFLDLAELDAVIDAVPEDTLGSTERVLYLTAAKTGLRQGELPCPSLEGHQVVAESPLGQTQLRPRRVRNAKVKTLESASSPSR